MAGTALGEWVRDHWNGQFDRLVTIRNSVFTSTLEVRLQSLKGAFESILGPVAPDKCEPLIFESSEHNEQSMAALLAQHPDLRRWVMVGTDDRALLDILAAARQLGREEEVVLVGLGASQLVFEELSRLGSPLIGSTVIYPELYGEKLIPLALEILRGEPVPPAVYMKQTFDFSLLFLRQGAPFGDENLSGIRAYRK
jgi:ribose transport system substrate-binding protein